MDFRQGNFDIFKIEKVSQNFQKIKPNWSQCFVTFNSGHITRGKKLYFLNSVDLSRSGHDFERLFYSLFIQT